MHQKASGSKPNSAAIIHMVDSTAKVTCGSPEARMRPAGTQLVYNEVVRLHSGPLPVGAGHTDTTRWRLYSILAG